MKKRLYTIAYIMTAFAIICLTSTESSAQCNVSTTPVNFGGYDTFSTAPLDATGTITVLCTTRESVTIAIGPSANSGGFDPRMMRLISGSELFEYNFYTRANHNRIWGDGSGRTRTMSRNVRRNRPWVRTVYGRILPMQDVSAGIYNDTLTVTITW